MFIVNDSLQILDKRMQKFNVIPRKNNTKQSKPAWVFVKNLNL